jgi:hypothetical protein
LALRVGWARRQWGGTDVGEKGMTSIYFLPQARAGVVARARASYMFEIRCCCCLYQGLGQWPTC